MIKKIAFLTFTSFIVLAESYAPPKLEQPKWDSVKSDVQKESYAVEEDASKGIDTRIDNSTEDLNSKERKPSSGDEAKPKFWDFKVVK